jgi:transcription antitermination factor NusG
MRFMQETAEPSFPMIDDVFSVDQKKKWFVVYTNPKCEGKAESGISNARICTYAPKSTTWRKRSRREKHQKSPKVKISRPLFTRYVMIEMPIQADGGAPFGLIREIDGVREFVSAAGLPLAASAEQIDRVRVYEEAGVFDDTVKKGRIIAPRWAVKGARCQVSDGPFASSIGLIEECLPHDRVKVMVSIFGRQTLVELELDQINPV